jgi:glycosyltransferase involved in cell wall biosynthesis
LVAPVAVKVAVCPAQIEVEFILIVGVAVTLTVVVVILEFTQPLALVPVTVNTVVVVGLIEMLFPLTPLDQVYVFAPVTDKIELARAKKLYNLPDDYMFFLGNTDPKKNVIGVLKALSILKKKNLLKSKLLMLDINRNYLQGLMKQINDESLMDDIVFSGYVPNKDLPAIYSQANLFLYPSLRESFGIPMLEAMACGAPLITSNTSSMPEIAQNSAVFVNPFNPDEIADAIIKVQNGEQLRQDLMIKGFERVKEFTWYNNAQLTLNIYKQFVV